MAAASISRRALLQARAVGTPPVRCRSSAGEGHLRCGACGEVEWPGRRSALIRGSCARCRENQELKDEVQQLRSMLGAGHGSEVAQAMSQLIRRNQLLKAGTPLPRRHG